MKFLALPWLELAFGATLAGSLFVTSFRNPSPAFRWKLAFSGTSFGFAVLAWLAFSLGVPQEMIRNASPQAWLLGRQVFRLDELSIR